MLVVLVLGIWKCCGNWLFCPKECVDGSWNSVSPTELFPFSDIPGSCCHHSSAIRSKFTFYYLRDRIQDFPPLPEEHFEPLIFVYLIFLCVCVIISACNWHGLDRFNSTLVFSLSLQSQKPWYHGISLNNWWNHSFASEKNADSKEQMDLPRQRNAVSCFKVRLNN